VAITCIAVASAGSSDGSTAATDAIDTTGATLLIAAAAGLYDTPSTIIDPDGNTWTALSQTVEGTNAERLYWCVPTVVGPGRIFGVDLAGTYPTLWVAAFSGTAASPYDQESGAAATGESVQPGSLTPPGDGCLFVVGLNYNNKSGGADDAGFTGTDIPNTGNNTHMYAGYLIQATAAPVNPTLSCTGGAAYMAARMATFKPAGGGPPLAAGASEFLASGPNDGSPYVSVRAAAPTGGTGAGPTYQWERADDGGSFADVTSATSLDLVDTTVADGHSYVYRCKQTKGSETVTTDPVPAGVYEGGFLTRGNRTPVIRRGR